MTILELIQATTPYFEKNRVESPRLTIELILAHVLQTTRMKLYLEFDRVLTPSELDILRPLAKKRAEGHPLQYVLGIASFSGRNFKVTSDVLIPRPETEILLEIVKKEIDPQGAPILDVGTGSGILAIHIATLFPELKVWGCDLSEKAIEIAKSNAEGLSNLEWHQDDLLSNPPTPKAQWVLANLPYIPSTEIPTLAREVQKEPVLALDGGSDGLDLIRKLIPQSALLKASIALEIWRTQGEAIKKILEENQYQDVKILQDFRQMDRVVIAKRKT